MNNCLGYEALAAAVIHRAIKDLSLNPKNKHRKDAELFFETGDYEGWASIAAVDPQTIRAWYRLRKATAA